MADERSKEYMTEVSQVLMSSLEKICEPKCVPSSNTLAVFVTTTSAFTDLKWSTNESYELNIANNDGCKRNNCIITSYKHF